MQNPKLRMPMKFCMYGKSLSSLGEVLGESTAHLEALVSSSISGHSNLLCSFQQCTSSLLITLHVQFYIS